jgi:hypothetical protein
MSEFPGKIQEQELDGADLTVVSQLELFEQFVSEIRDSEDEVCQYTHSGVADFLHYKLGHLKGSSFEIMGPETTGLYREIRDNGSNTTIYMNPLDCERPCLLYESRLVNDKGKPVCISYKDEEQTPISPTTESYPYPPYVLNQGHPNHFTLSKADLVRGFRAIRKAVKQQLIQPIIEASGYKWAYSRSTYKNRVYFLHFSCFQDSKADMVPSKSRMRHLFPVYEPQPCQSSLSVGIHIFSKKYVIQYYHKKHRKLLDIVCSLMCEMYDNPVSVDN